MNKKCTEMSEVQEELWKDVRDFSWSGPLDIMFNDHLAFDTCHLTDAVTSLRIACNHAVTEVVAS